jgi:hypothetical protein
MSHAGMTADIGNTYQELVLQQDKEVWGWFSYGGVTIRCVVEKEVNDEYLIRYFYEDDQTFTQIYIEKNKVTLDRDVEELAFWVLRNKLSGLYYYSGRDGSTAPKLYLTKSKAEGRRKQQVMPDNWEVKKWVISEREA